MYILKQLFFSISVNNGFRNIYLDLKVEKLLTIYINTTFTKNVLSAKRINKDPKFAS